MVELDLDLGFLMPGACNIEEKDNNKCKAPPLPHQASGLGTYRSFISYEPTLVCHSDTISPRPYSETHLLTCFLSHEKQ